MKTDEIYAWLFTPRKERAHLRKCAKCGHLHSPPTHDPEAACPNCETVRTPAPDADSPKREDRFG